MSVEVSGDELAGLLGLTDRRVRQLAALGVLEKTGRGRYQLGPAIQAYTKFRVTHASREIRFALSDLRRMNPLAAREDTVYDFAGHFLATCIPRLAATVPPEALAAVATAAWNYLTEYFTSRAWIDRALSCPQACRDDYRVATAYDLWEGYAPEFEDLVRELAREGHLPAAYKRYELKVPTST